MNDNKIKIYQQRYKCKNSKTLKTKNFYLGFGYGNEPRKYIRMATPFKSFGPARAFADKVEKLLEYQEHGRKPDEELSYDIMKLPQKLQMKLIKLNLIGNNLVAAKELETHIKDWQEGLIDSSKYKQEAPARVRRICKECGFLDFSGIDMGQVQVWINKRLDESLSPETISTYIRNLKSFCTWMCKCGRAVKSPVEYLKTLNPAVGKKRPRRALTVEEQRVLLQVTQEGELVHGLTGMDRSYLYLVALETGLRYGELYSLTCSSFHLDEEPPYICVEAGASKHRKKDIVPLRRSTVQKLKSFIGGRSADEKAFLGMWKKRGADALRQDLKSSRKKWLKDHPKEKDSDFLKIETSEGICDFHSLRHSYVTNLSTCGVHPSVAQKLSRHSSIELTMNRYTHTVQDSLVQAQESLPELLSA